MDDKCKLQIIGVLIATRIGLPGHPTPARKQHLTKKHVRDCAANTLTLDVAAAAADTGRAFGAFSKSFAW